MKKIIESSWNVKQFGVENCVGTLNKKKAFHTEPT